jgi:hypothetical protein
MTIGQGSGPAQLGGDGLLNHHYVMRPPMKTTDTELSGASGW